MPKAQENITSDIDENQDENQENITLVPNIYDSTKLVPAGSETLYPVWLDAALGGAPTKCNLDITITVCNNLAKGGYIEAACAAAGIPKTRYYEWIKLAERDEKQGKIPGFNGNPDESVFIAFRHAVKIARQNAEQLLVSKIHDAEGDKTWMRLAWILERTRPDKYGQRQQITVDHTLRATIEAAPEPPKDLDAFLRRAVTQAETARRLQSIAQDAEYADVTEQQQDTEVE